MGVKQKILQHEYGEVIKDEYSEHGHISLILKQGRSVGLGVDDILQAEPIPTTRATLYGWAWITREKPWLEGLAALTVTEWCNDDRLLMDQGGGNSTRMARRWIEDMGIHMKDMPNFEVHSQADEEHSDMFLPDLSQPCHGLVAGAGAAGRQGVPGAPDHLSRGHRRRHGAHSGRMPERDRG